MGPVDWLVVAFWGLTVVELVLEARKKRWGAVAFSAAVLGLLTWLAWPRFVYLAGVVSSWLSGGSGSP